MYYCPNCGAKLEEQETFCRFCGQDLIDKGEEIDKDARIRALEQKISQLEQQVQTSKKSYNKNTFNNNKWIFIAPIGFVAIFFTFFILMIVILRS